MIKLILYKWFGIEEPPCTGCEVLKEELAHERFEKEILLRKILELSEPVQLVATPPVQELPEPVRPKVIPWAVRKEMLEAESRAALKIKNELEEQERIAKLEKELGVTENADAKSV